MQHGRVIIYFLALLALPASAKELYGPEAGVVPYGMGRAYSAITDDWLALHYNPAGLAMVNRVDFQLFDIKASSNNDVLKSYSLLSGLGKTSGGNLADSISGLAGKHIMGNAGNITQLTIPHAALAMNYDVHTDFDMENLSNPSTQLRYTRDLMFIAGGAAGFGKHQDLRFGASIKWITRTGSVKTVPVTQIAGSKSSVTGLFNQSGSGIGGDVGMQYRLPFEGKVEYTTSFVWHDMGNTTFGTAQQQNVPTRIDQNMVAGLGIRVPIGGTKNRRLERRYGPTRSSSHLSFAFDYSHLNYSAKKEDPIKHVHLGTNLDLPLFSFQLGLNQSALTFGTSFDIGIVRVALATYGEEIGSYAGQKVDRRYLLSVGSSFGFSGK